MPYKPRDTTNFHLRVATYKAGTIAPADPGEVVVPVRTFVDSFVLAQADWLEGEDMKPVADMLRGLLSDLRAAEAALAALPPSSGWEAGAEAMKEAAAVVAGSWVWAKTGLKIEQVAEIEAELRAIPLPPPPSREG